MDINNKQYSISLSFHVINWDGHIIVIHYVPSVISRRLVIKQGPFWRDWIFKSDLLPV